MSRLLPEYNQLMRFTINDICNWLQENKFGEFVKKFREHGIDGNRFVSLQDLDLTRMGCPMNKRRDLLKLIKDLPKPTESRVRTMVQPTIPATPVKDYSRQHQRPPAPVPVPEPQNGDLDDEEGSGPEDDYEWAQSDFSDVSSDEEEDYENSKGQAAPQVSRSTNQQPAERKDVKARPDGPDSLVDKLKSALVQREKTIQRPVEGSEEDQDSDSGSVGSYEEPNAPHSPPPPSVPRRNVPAPIQQPAHHVLPVNKRPVPKLPPQEDQAVYEDTNEEEEQQVYDETMDQPVYDDPEESAPVTSKAGRRQLPPPEPEVKTSSLPRKGKPALQTRKSEPEIPAPPPPRSKGKPKQKIEEPSTPAPPPPRGGRKQPLPVPEEPQDVYEDPDNPQANMPTDVYVDPDENTPPPPPPSRSKASLPPVPKAAGKQQKGPPPVKKAPPPVEEQLTYEVPDEMQGEIPQDDYMEMQPTPDDVKSPQNKVPHKGVPVIPVIPSNGTSKPSAKTTSLPPRPGKHSKQLPVPEPSTNDSINQNSKTKSYEHRPLPQPVEKTSSIGDQEWYHGDIDRSVADNKLLNVGTNGCYLIRQSKKGGETKPYTLAIIYSGQVFNLNIRKKTNTKYALGMAKPGEQEFTDLLELVNFFKTHRLILAKGQTRLKKPCPK